MKKLLLFSSLILIILLSGCNQRYQVFTLLEMEEEVIDQGSSKGNTESMQNASTELEFIQRVLVDTQTGKMYYFPNYKTLEVLQSE